MPNDAQLDAGAGGIAYRCEQLAVTALIIGRRRHTTVTPSLGVGVDQIVTNSLIESSLVHARALAYFLGTTKLANVAAAHYGAEVSAELAKVASESVIAPVSDHLAHSKFAKKVQRAEEVKHPGAWPITELAVVLVGGVASVVAEMSAERAASFDPDPRLWAEVLEAAVGGARTNLSENESVARLTTALQAYLDR